MTGVHVFADLISESAKVGIAYFNQGHGSLSTSFAYDSSWIARRDAYAIDPRLPMSHQGHVSGLPGAFQDCSPDRWGRRLIEKKTKSEASQQGGTQRSVTELDYLLEVSDLTRQGNLRFSRSDDPPRFLAAGTAVPKLIQLPALLAASDRFLAHEADDLPAIKTLLDAGGSSLGGARPKASIADGDELLIAKFPHQDDEWDVMAWEKTALDIAENAGCTVPPRRLAVVDGRSVLLLSRFDRHRNGRIGYLSAMSMLRASDGESRDYADLADELFSQSASASRDGEELYRRVAVSVAINNTDDHLRNHGFLRSASGWSLSPVFDINPNPDPHKERATSIVGDYHGSPDSLAQLAEWCDIDGRRRTRIDAQVATAAARWRDIAASNGCSERDIDMFAPTFGLGANRLMPPPAPSIARRFDQAGPASQLRGKTTPQSNRGSFAPRTSSEADPG